jgi:predicted exporter
MLTTLLTLGMLVFSTTQAISSFGIVLVSGIFSAWLLSPLAMPHKKRKVK